VPLSLRRIACNLFIFKHFASFYGKSFALRRYLFWPHIFAEEQGARMADEVLTELRGTTALLTLNLPERRNPLTASLRVALTNALRSLAKQAPVRCVVLTGADPAFCSGMDLNELAELPNRKRADHRADARALLKLFELIRNFPKPLIAAVNGPAIAGGCGVALLADIVVAGPDARFAFSEVRIGFVPALVGVYAEHLLGSALTREMLLTGRSVPAKEAWECGLVGHLVETNEQILPYAFAVAEQFKSCSPSALKVTKELLAKCASRSFESSLKQAVEINSRARCTSECQEGVQAFLEKRAPSWANPG
jgi:methylglutaconyl-CoA hydratase